MEQISTVNVFFERIPESTPKTDTVELSISYPYVSTDNELLMNNIRCTPEVVRSYEKVKDVYGRKNKIS